MAAPPGAAAPPRTRPQLRTNTGVAARRRLAEGRGLGSVHACPRCANLPSVLSVAVAFARPRQFSLSQPNRRGHVQKFWPHVVVRDAVGLAADVAAMTTARPSPAPYARRTCTSRTRSACRSRRCAALPARNAAGGLPAKRFGMACGLVAVVLGVLFLEGVKHGVAPLATDLGQHLPRVLPQWAVMLVAFGLGVGVTSPSEALGALTNGGKMVDVQRAPMRLPASSTTTATSRGRSPSARPRRRRRRRHSCCAAGGRADLPSARSRRRSR